MIITIDGPAGAGKSTVARSLASRLGFRFLDTGAMYRAVTLAILRAQLVDSDGEEIAKLARRLTIGMEADRVLLDGEDVTEEIRSEDVTAHVHIGADNQQVRSTLVQRQRQFATVGDVSGVVTEGRDQGTVVFPDAACKIFLTASDEQRAKRRQQDLARRGTQVSLKDVLTQQQERDARDRSREVGRLICAEDAVSVETDNLTLDQVVDHLVQLVLAKDASSPSRAARGTSDH